MSNRPQTVAHQRTYTRNEFTALRAYVQHVAAATIGRLYLGEDESGDPLTAAAVERRMRDMQADLVAVAQPVATHAVGMWFRPLVAVRLKSQHIATLAELVAFCNARGGTWWRAVSRIGAGRARHIVAWLRQHEATIGLRVIADVDICDPLTAPHNQIIEVGGRANVLAPLERMAVAHPLSGSTGENRPPLFPYVQAPNE